jgi:flagellar biosynthesis/type III secretory pathway ATPase
VLVDGDDFNDPVTDAARSILDGHVNLSRQLAARNHFPAIDILTSASRVMVDITEQQHQTAVSQLRDLMATYQKNEDLISIGAYNQGANPKIDRAIRMQPKIEEFLRQGRNEKSSFVDSLQSLHNLLETE